MYGPPRPLFQNGRAAYGWVGGTAINQPSTSGLGLSYSINDQPSCSVAFLTFTPSLKTSPVSPGHPVVHPAFEYVRSNKTWRPIFSRQAPRNSSLTFSYTNTRRCSLSIAERSVPNSRTCVTRLRTFGLRSRVSRPKRWMSTRTLHRPNALFALSLSTRASRVPLGLSSLAALDSPNCGLAARISMTG